MTPHARWQLAHELRASGLPWRIIAARLNVSIPRAFVLALKWQEHQRRQERSRAARVLVAEVMGWRGQALGGDRPGNSSCHGGGNE